MLVPCEDIDLSELRVAQEWVDIPALVGDYYLGIQVQPDEGFVKVWGYCTHAQLKNHLNYDAVWRTYALNSEDITTDLSLLTLAREFCSPQITRKEIAPLTNLTSQQAQYLISRLGNPQVIAPRLEIPFAMWGALIEHGGWRKSLYERRLGLPEQWSIIEWLQNGVAPTARELGWRSFDIQAGTAEARSITLESVEKIISRELTIAGQSYLLSIIPQTGREEIIWRFVLCNVAVGGFIPGGFKLRLLTEDLQSFPNNEDIAVTAVEQLFVEVLLQPGEGIVWEIEPMPDSNGDREILRF